MSGGGSGGTSYQQNNSTSQSGPPTPIAWMLNDIAGQRYGQYQANPNAPAYYPGQTVAQFGQQSEAGLNSLFNRGANGSPLQTGGQNLAQSTLGGQYLDLANNPYFQGAISYAQQPVIDAFNKQILPGIGSMFSGAGRTPQAGNLAGNAVNSATDTLTRNLAGAATQAGAGAYDAERARQQQTLGLLPSFQQMDYNNANAMLQAGALRDEKAQQNIDAAIAKYNYEQNAQGDYQTRVAQQIQSIYPGGTNTGTSYSSGNFMQPGMGTGGWLGAGLGAAGLGLQAAKLFGLFSDRRAKTDIEPLGVDPLTGMKMYA